MRLACLFLVLSLAGCSSETSAPSGSCDIPGGGRCAVGESGCHWDCNACTCRAPGVLECTTMGCGDVGAPSDSMADTAADDTATDAASCGDKTCGASQVCVVPCCAPPCKPAPPFCADVPASCSGAPGCSCMADKCSAPSACGGMIDGRLQCACF
ncbi:MAG: hypothetical protein ACXWUG_23275 [Polyangiales bacterium]